MPEGEDLKLVESIEKNTKRYIDVVSQAVDEVMPRETKDVTYVEFVSYVNALAAKLIGTQIQR
jgi:DNA replication licensing factor MCM7